LGLVEERALVVEPTEGHRREDNVGGVEGAQDDVVVRRGSIDEEVVAGEVRRREDTMKGAIADGVAVRVHFDVEVRVDNAGKLAS
jgi:hypothetical protein